MSLKSLRVGDLIRITALPAGVGTPGYYIHRDTKRAYRELIARKRPVRIARWGHGHPWFDFRLRDKSGTLHWHSLNVMEGDDNWARVKHRKKMARSMKKR